MSASPYGLPGPRRRSGQLTAAWIAAAATVIAAVIAGLVVFATDDPPPHPPETQMGGDISDIQFSVGNPCCRFSVQFVAIGFKGKICQLEATVVDAVTGAQGAPFSQEFIIEADTDRANADVPVDLQSVVGSYYVIFVLRGPNGFELDRYATYPFDVR